MKFILHPIRFFYSIYALLIFVILTLFAFPLAVAGSFFGKIKGGNFIYNVCRIWGFVWYFLVGIRHKNLYEAPHDTTRHYIFVANHCSYMDIPPTVMALWQPIRVLGKYESSKIPVFGYIYKKAVVMVDRSNAEKRSQSVRRLTGILKNNISIFIFPEGTFNMTEAPLKNFYDGAFRIAIETGTNIKPILFVDTLDRLHFKSLFSLTPGPCRCVFLEEIPVKGYTINDINLLKNKVYKIMEAGLMRYRAYPTKL